MFRLHARSSLTMAWSLPATVLQKANLQPVVETCGSTCTMPRLGRSSSAIKVCGAAGALLAGICWLKHMYKSHTDFLQGIMGQSTVCVLRLMATHMRPAQKMAPSAYGTQTSQLGRQLMGEPLLRATAFSSERA